MLTLLVICGVSIWHALPLAVAFYIAAFAMMEPSR